MPYVYGWHIDPSHAKKYARDNRLVEENDSDYEAFSRGLTDILERSTTAMERHGLEMRGGWVNDVSVIVFSIAVAKIRTDKAELKQQYQHRRLPTADLAQVIGKDVNARPRWFREDP